MMVVPKAEEFAGATKNRQSRNDDLLIYYRC